MADTLKTEGEGSPQNVAFKLMHYLASAERFENRKQILDAYAECLDAAHGARGYRKQLK